MTSTSFNNTAKLKRDTLFNGALICYQHEKGYRFSIDAVLLAHFVEVKKEQRILDLGTGSGIISLILLHLNGDLLSQCSGIELQQPLFHLAEKNIAANNFKDKNKLYQGDVRDIRQHLTAGSYDAIVCNPPFYPASSGRKNSNEESNLARHQISATTDDFLAAAAFAVRNKGEVFFIYPSHLYADFIIAAARHSLIIKTSRFVYSYPQSEKGAQLVLIKCRKNGGSGLEIKSPLYIYKEKNGEYTKEVESYYTGPSVS